MKIYIPCRKYNIGGKKITINYNGITYVLAKNKTIEIPDFLLGITREIEPLARIVTALDEFIQRLSLNLVIVSSKFDTLLNSSDLNKQKTIKFRRYHEL